MKSMTMARDFYLTDNIELAKEWAVCRPNEYKWLGA